MLVIWLQNSSPVPLRVLFFGRSAQPGLLGLAEGQFRNICETRLRGAGCTRPTQAKKIQI
jgi:hypothetical protein